MKSFAKIILPAFAFGGMAYVAYKEYRKRHKPSVVVTDFDPADMTYDSDLDRMLNQQSDNSDENHGQDSDADSSRTSYDSDHASSGNLDHLFVPKTLSSSQRASVSKMSSNLSSAVRKIKSENTSHPTNSQCQNKGDQNQ